MPAIASFPGHIEPDTINREFVSVLDVMPTLLELAGVTHPGTSYRGRPVYPLEGKSMLAMLTGKADRVHGQNDLMAWEIFDRRAVIQGEWKLLLLEPPWGTGEWQLYNLETDPAEQTDLARQYPELTEQMGTYWEEYRTRVGIVPMEGGTKF